MFKKVSKILVSVQILVLLFSISTSAATPYDTYSYSCSGDMQISPDAYSAEYEVSEFGDYGTLKSPEDIIFDRQRGYIIIADTGNNRIVVVDSDFNSVAEIAEFQNNGKSDSFDAPSGVFLTEDLYLYVADTNKGRIMVFDSNFSFYRELPALSADILPESYIYKPKSVAVDNAKNVYVVSKSTNMGVIALDPTGAFQGFIGAQKVSTNAVEAIWRSLMSEEQLERSTSYVPVEYSDLTIDEKGFLYVTCSNIDRYDLYTAIQTHSKSETYAPIKKINPSGTDVLRRNGFFPPVGDINFDAYDGKDSIDPSQIAAVTLLENGSYTLLDAYQNKLFTYDYNGNLLYAFGGTGDVIGLYTQLAGVAYNDETMYTLDSFDGTVTVSVESEYGLLLKQVVSYQSHRKYDEAKKMWSTIIKQNNNFDCAYLGMARIYMEKGQYKDAMRYFKLVDDKTNYSKAYKFYRQEILDKWGIAVFAGIVALILLLVWLFTKVNKHNKRVIYSPASKKFSDEILYAFHTMRHPIDGYWGLKVEKRGSVRSATFFWILTAASSIFSTLGACYLQKDSEAGFLSALTSTVIPMALWCISNMCFTSLMDGKGSFKDVYIAVGYSTAPYNLVMIPCTLISHFLVSDELSILSLVMNVALYWSVALIILSMMTIHEYSFGKNMLVTVLTIFGMAFILFILLIFFNLTGRVQTLIVNIVNEIAYRS